MDKRKIANIWGLIIITCGFAMIWKFDGIYDAVGVLLILWAHNIEYHKDD